MFFIIHFNPLNFYDGNSDVLLPFLILIIWVFSHFFSVILTTDLSVLLIYSVNQNHCQSVTDFSFLFSCFLFHCFLLSSSLFSFLLLGLGFICISLSGLLSYEFSWLISHLFFWNGHLKARNFPLSSALVITKPNEI